jgi:hypothetical protein
LLMSSMCRRDYHFRFLIIFQGIAGGGMKRCGGRRNV